MEESIMNHMKTFKDLLSHEADALSYLEKLENQKFDALKQVDIKKLMRINSDEEEMLHKLEVIEKKRKNLILLLSEAFSFDPCVSLSELFTYLPDEEYKSYKNELSELRNTIKGFTEKLQVTMHENSEMIRTNLDIINLTLNFANRNSQKETYGYRDKKESRENIYLVNQIA